MDAILGGVLEGFGRPKWRKTLLSGGRGGPPGMPKKEKKAKKKAGKFWHAGLLPKGRGRRIYRLPPLPPTTPAFDEWMNGWLEN